MAWAQSGDVTGTITDAETGETLPGVNVLLTEIDRGGVTNPDGVYTISNVPPGDYTIRASYVGYDTYEAEVTIEGDEVVTHDIEMQTGAVGLDEVVVTGYGTQQTAGEISGSISNIGGDEVNDIPVQNAEQLLQGRAAGVTVNSTSGNPGGNFEIEIRGEGSINAGDDPLYIVDGVPISQSEGPRNTSWSPLASLNPSDIESMEVLKDAAAASIYGAQASNGVVLITTKRGREGEPNVSINYEGGVRYQPNRYDMMNRDQWLDAQIDATSESFVRNSILTSYGYDADVDFSELRDFNWQDFIFRRGSSHSTSFNASGGTETTQYFLSGSWERTEAAAKEVLFREYSFRTNLTQQFTPSMEVDANINLSNQKMPGVCQDGFYVNCPFYQGLAEEPPISYPYMEDGSYNPNTEQAAHYNPAITLFEEDRDTDVTQVMGNLSPRLTVAPWLSLRGTLGIDWQRHEETDYESPVSRPADGGTVNRTFDDLTNITINATADAQRTFGESHNVNLLAGTEYRREKEDDDSYSFNGFNNSLLRVPSAANENTFFSGFNTEFRVLSYFSQLNYNYDERYILTVTGRYDGHSRFGADRRWGFFPSVSGAWRIAQEEFFTADFVDELKVRASYGVTGNSSIGNFAARGLYGTSGSYDERVGIAPSQLANRQLTWEEAREVNLALDWSFWQGRLTGNLDFYRTDNNELLLDRPLPRSSGYGNITENVGRVQNRGVELTLETVNVQTEDFRWSTRLTAGVNQNEIKELTGDEEALNPGGFHERRVGQSLRTWNVPIWAGVNPADGRPMYYDQDGNLTYQPDTDDYQNYDGAEEDLQGGLGTRLSYQGLSLDVFFQYSYGARKRPNAERTYTLPFGEGMLAFVDERWREPGDMSYWPRAEYFGSFDGARNPSGTSSWWLFDGSYVRLKNVSLSYSLPQSVAQTVSLSGARVYVSGNNLKWWGSYLGLDPEVSGSSESASFPDEAQINVGVEVNL